MHIIQTVSRRVLFRTAALASASTLLSEGTRAQESCLSKNTLEYAVKPYDTLDNVPIYLIMPEYLEKVEEAYLKHHQKHCQQTYDPTSDNGKALLDEKIKFILTVFKKAGDTRSDEQIRSHAAKILKAYTNETAIQAGLPSHYNISEERPPIGEERYFLNEQNKKEKIKAGVVVGPKKGFTPEQFLSAMISERPLPWIRNPAGTSDDYRAFMILHEKFHCLGFGEAQCDYLAAHSMLEKNPDGSKIPFIKSIMHARLMAAILQYETKFSENYGLQPYFALRFALGMDKKLTIPGKEIYEELTSAARSYGLKRDDLSEGMVRGISVKLTQHPFPPR